MITLTITQWPRLQRPRQLSALRLLVGDHHYLETRPLGLACFGISQGKVRDVTKCWMSQVPGISFEPEVFGISKNPKGYPKSMKDILLPENLEWDIPK
jgi:hypothetical protein